MEGARLNHRQHAGVNRETVSTNERSGWSEETSDRLLPPHIGDVHGGATGADQDQVDKDAMKRASLRAAGIGVWILTWPDVRVALTAVSQESTVGPVTPLSNAARHAASQGAKQANSWDHPVFEALGQGAVGGTACSRQQGIRFVKDNRCVLTRLIFFHS